MNERELRDALRRAAPEDEAARERSWRVVRAAYAGRGLRARRRRWPALLLVLALLPVAVGGAAAATTPDRGVGEWVRSVFGAGKRDTQPALVRVLGGGRLLVTGGDGAWVVSANGSKRRLGAYSGASWSPRGLFVIAWRGRELTALDPGGRVRWSLARTGAIASARWGAVDGFRVAYVTGDELRIVNGDGSGDHRYGAARRRVAPAWRPDDSHVLAYVDGRERVSVVAVDSRLRRWRSSPMPGLVELAWSPGGRRLLAVGGRSVVLFDGSGRRLASRAVRAGFELRDAQWSPSGDQIALVRRSEGAARSEIVLLDAAHGLRSRVPFKGPGEFGGLAWSPSGARLLVGWPDADQWLFLRPHGGGRLSAVANIARQFMPGADRPAFPRDVEWCCRSAPSAGP